MVRALRSGLQSSERRYRQTFAVAVDDGTVAVGNTVVAETAPSTEVGQSEPVDNRWF